jgi:hypothetical protein
MLQLPFFEKLRSAKNVLLAGCGGGFDIYCGLPLYFALKSADKNVHLANLSFANLPRTPKTKPENWLTPYLYKVTSEIRSSPALYFPEYSLCKWFSEQGMETPIYCFENTGVKPLVNNYETLIKTLEIDTIILVDGGTDSLMRGDEAGLGTPMEDISSITAVNQLLVERKMLVCLGFGVDHYHGVCHAQFLEAVADLTRSQGYLGMFSLMQEMPEVQLYQQACQSIFQKMSEHYISIVSTSILSSLEGHYGNYQTNARTAKSKLWINPLMPVYWCFQIEQVAQRILYLEQMKQTETHADVMNTVMNFRNSGLHIKQWESIPI